jgi:hypothetical protein
MAAALVAALEPSVNLSAFPKVCQSYHAARFSQQLVLGFMSKVPQMLRCKLV